MSQIDRLKKHTLIKVAHIQRDHLMQITGDTQQEGLYAVDYYSSNDKDTWIPTKMHMNLLRMPHTIITKRELALELIAKYYHNPDKCSLSSTDGRCRYYDKKTGNKCIMGMCMKSPQSFSEDMNCASILLANKPEVREILQLHPIITSIFQLADLRMLQAVHDIIAKKESNRNYELDAIFKSFNNIVEPSMRLNVKAIERHIADTRPMWLPFHK